MAIKLPLIVIFSLLFLVNVCKARHYGMISDVSISQSLKQDFKGKLTTTEVLKAVSKQEGKATTSLAHSTLLMKGMLHRREAISVVLKKSIVSWQVPSKHHDHYPGIYSDYPKPRSRPPSHN